MNPGDFNIKISIEQDTGITKNEYNEPVKNWVEFCQAWAKKDFRSANESKKGNQIVGADKNNFTIQFYQGITRKMRIKDTDNNIYHITGIKTIGYNQYLQLETEFFDNE